MGDFLTPLSTALELTKRLRDISKEVENAEFKMALADLASELADAKLRAAELVTENAELKEKLLQAVNTTGDPCPKCHNATFELISSEPHPQMGIAGVKDRTYKCSTCDFEDTIMWSPRNN